MNIGLSTWRVARRAAGVLAAAGVFAVAWCGPASADLFRDQLFDELLDTLQENIDGEIVDLWLGDTEVGPPQNIADIAISYSGRVTYRKNNTLVTVPFAGSASVRIFGLGDFRAPVIQWDHATAGEGGATDVSGDPFVTGYLDHGDGTPYHAFRYDLETAEVLDLGALTQDGQSIGLGVSADGGVVVGAATVDGGWQHAFRWTAAGGSMVDLGSASGGEHDQSRAMGVSDDGNVVFGASDFPSTVHSGTVSHAFAWTATGGYQDLGVIGNNNSIAMAATHDGSVIVGGGGNRAFRWTAATGMVDLGAPEGAADAGSIATDVSDNGMIVVGEYSTSNDFLGSGTSVDNFGYILGADSGAGTMHAFRWTDAAQGGTGMADLRALMITSGVDMSGIDLVTADSISGDGQYISGQMTTAATGTSHSVPYLLQYCDAFVDACTSGVTTPQQQTVSVQELADARAAVSGHLDATAGLLLGSLSPVSGPADAEFFAGAGSITAGAHGRWGDDNVMLLGGVALTQQEYGAVDVTQALVVAGGLRHIWTGGALRPFVEAGGWAAPGIAMTFSRDYGNGATTATGTGSTSGLAASLYARGGVIWAPAAGNELVLAGAYQHNWLRTDAYTESSVGNPFPATFSDGALATDVLKLSLAWTTRINESLDLTLTGALGHAFASGQVDGTMAGGGTVATAAQDYTLAEVGARIGYKMNDQLSLNGFGFASTGTSIGTHFTVGGGLSFRF